MAYNPSQSTVSNKPYAPSQAVPTDARTYYYDATLFKYRPFQNTSEVISYLNTSTFRTGQYPAIVNVGGTLNSDGTFTGGVLTEYWFRNGTSDGDLVQKTVDKTSQLTNDAGFLTSSSISGKEDVSNKSNTTTLGTSTTLYPTQNAVKVYVDTVASGKQNTIATGTTSQYIRGDGSLATLDKSAVGLGNVVNADTSTTANITDSSNKRFVTDAQQGNIANLSGTNTGDETATTIRTKIGAASSTNNGYLSSTDWSTFSAKQNALGFTPENSANKGAANGYASLGSDGKVPSDQLPAGIGTPTWDAVTAVGNTSTRSVLVSNNTASANLSLQVNATGASSIGLLGASGVSEAHIQIGKPDGTQVSLDANPTGVAQLTLISRNSNSTQIKVDSANGFLDVVNPSNTIINRFLMDGRISGDDAVNSTEFTTLQQVEDLISVAASAGTPQDFGFISEPNI